MTMTTLRFRPAGLDDAERVAALHADSWRRHYRGAYTDAFLDGDVFADRRETWTSRLAEPGDSLTIIAEPAGAEAAVSPLTAFVHVVFDRDEHWGSLIDNLHVAYDHKRSGIGRALMGRAADAVADRASGKALYLWVLEQNVAAQSFYGALGGTRGERVPTSAPGGDPSRLNTAPGSDAVPHKFRITWPDAATLRDAANAVAG